MIIVPSLIRSVVTAHAASTHPRIDHSLGLGPPVHHVIPHEESVQPRLLRLDSEPNQQRRIPVFPEVWNVDGVSESR